MNMLHTSLARCLAVIALLFTLALNLELTHSHADHNESAHCVACKSSASGEALLSAAVPLQEPTGKAWITGTADAVVVSFPFSLFLIRGPPQVS